MPRRRNKKARRSGGGGGDDSRERHQNCNNNNNNRTPSTSSPATSLEEDLMQQRIRQRMREQKKLQKKEEDAKLKLHRQQNIFDDNDNEDPRTIDDDMPIESVNRRRKPQHLLHKNAIGPLDHYFAETGLERHSSSTTRCSSFSLGYLLEQSSALNRHHRQRLRQIWHTKYLYENFDINKKASLLYNKKLRWIDHSLPNGIICPWDLACKHYLHPSSRTLDVGMATDSGDDTHQMLLPSIATTVQGGWALLNDSKHSEPHLSSEHIIHRQHRGGIYTMRSKAVHAIRIHEKSNRCGTVVRWDNSRSTPYKFHYYSLQNLSSSYIEAGLYEPVNDFCFGSDLVVFACPRFSGGHTIQPMFMPLDIEGSHGDGGNLRALNVRNFPSSDALCVEMTCENNEKYVAFGHRNGQVSLIDLRQSSTVCSIFQHLSSSSKSPKTSNGGGSATALRFVNSAKQLLVQRSFGTSQLHDLRMSSNGNNNESSSSLIFNLTTPQDDRITAHETLSAHCNGFVVDPVAEQTMISSYINSKQEACLGVWSLGTGIFLGSTVIASNPDQDIIHTEICQNTTPAYVAKGAKKKDGCFGFWLKCGRFCDSKSKVNAKFGSLHHVSMPGSSA